MTAAVGPSSFSFLEFSHACEYKALEVRREEFCATLLQPITVHEYAMKIVKMKYWKASGPSDATATMINAWPENMHERVLQWLNEIWADKQVPQWWYYGHLRPTPLDNLRPLGLYEISRKIVTRRKYDLWERKAVDFWILRSILSDVAEVHHRL